MMAMHRFAIYTHSTFTLCKLFWLLLYVAILLSVARRCMDDCNKVCSLIYYVFLLGLKYHIFADLSPGLFPTMWRCL